MYTLRLYIDEKLHTYMCLVSKTFTWKKNPSLFSSVYNIYVCISKYTNTYIKSVMYVFVYVTEDMYGRTLNPYIHICICMVCTSETSSSISVISWTVSQRRRTHSNELGS